MMRCTLTKDENKLALRPSSFCFSLAWCAMTLLLLVLVVDDEKVELEGTFLGCTRPPRARCFGLLLIGCTPWPDE